METRALIGIIAGGFAILSGGAFLYYFLVSRRQVDVRTLMSRTQTTSRPTTTRRGGPLDDPNEDEEARIQRLKQETKKAMRTKPRKELTLDEKFFQAGIFSDDDKKEFARLRLLLPFFTAPLFAAASFYFGGADLAIAGLVLGILGGLQLPYTILDRKINARAEEIMFYLPLVIEQIVIGVSSSLDIGPCLQRVVSMADERDSHNVVTELVRHAQYYLKSGVSLEDSLVEVGKLSGHTELKHSFMSLSQVAKHGGEVTRQLQELADAVSSQRETQIESKIKKLELEATGPVALVFAGFLVILLIGFGIQLKGAF